MTSHRARFVCHHHRKAIENSKVVSCVPKIRVQRTLASNLSLSCPIQRGCLRECFKIVDILEFPELEGGRVHIDVSTDLEMIVQIFGDPAPLLASSLSLSDLPPIVSAARHRVRWQGSFERWLPSGLRLVASKGCICGPGARLTRVITSGSDRFRGETCFDRGLWRRRQTERTHVRPRARSIRKICRHVPRYPRPS